jgi:xyloglucan-specific exo-beta-1,4-glucanase
VRKRSVVAYQATADKYMAVNSNPPAQGGGTYVSIDGGASWTRKSTFNGNVGGNQLEAVLGRNHFFHGGGFTGGGLYYNRNDGVTWNAVTCNQGVISDVWAVSTGKVKSDNDYPSVYIYGAIGGDFGIWQSDNSDFNWSTMTAITFKKLVLPNDFWGTPAHICGDANTYGRVLVGSIANGLIEFNP